MTKIVIDMKVAGILFLIHLLALGLADDASTKNARQMFDGMNINTIIDEKYDENYNKTIYENLRGAINFTAPGRRISEVKCLEFLWKTKFSEERDIILYGRKAIVGGRPAAYGEFPHMAALGWRAAGNVSIMDEWTYKCGATLISESFMITAAHCSRTRRGDTSVANIYPEVAKIGDELTVQRYWKTAEDRAGNLLFDDDFSFRVPGRNSYGLGSQGYIIYANIKRIINHKDYKSPKRYNDIALIELMNKVQIGPVVRPACLWNTPDTSTLDRLRISGWGVVDPVTRTVATTLQAADVNLISDEICDEKLRVKRNRNWRGLADHQMCAGVLRGGVDTCEGDSGGPLQYRIRFDGVGWPMYYLVGVTSFGYSCALPDTPGVYTKIASYIDWIESTVWPSG